MNARLCIGRGTSFDTMKRPLRPRNAGDEGSSQYPDHNETYEMGDIPSDVGHSDVGHPTTHAQSAEKLQIPGQYPDTIPSLSDTGSVHSAEPKSPVDAAKIDALIAQVPPNKRPRHRLGFLGLWGRKVDTIEWCKARSLITFCWYYTNQSCRTKSRD